MRVELRSGAFQPWAELAEYERAAQLGTGVGATATFVGTMRDYNEGEPVLGMYLEHYPGMAERELSALVAAEVARFQLIDALVVHRVGALAPGDPIVLVAVWSGHRREGFEGCRAIMEALKARAPFWKRERTVGGERWVEKNTAGY